MCRRIFVKNKSNVKRGFTLVELLIVVLIVGILVSVALPLYQNAVDKSRWAKLLSPSRAIANAEEAVLMSNGAYTVNKEDLVVSLPNDGEYDYQLYTSANGDDGDLVRVSSDKLEDVRLARHYEKDARFPNQLYCEAKVGNARAKKLCEKLLQGSEVFTTDDGYKRYFLDGQMSEAVCEGADGWWSNNFTKCYASESERCTANGMSMQGSGDDVYCGYADNTYFSKTVKEGGKCINMASNRCANVTIDAGAECIVKPGSSDGCYNGTVNAGGKCTVEVDPNASIHSRSCKGTFEGGSKCVANVARSCEGTYKTGSCCEGDFCPSYAPSCQD